MTFDELLARSLEDLGREMRAAAAMSDCPECIKFAPVSGRPYGQSKQGADNA